MPHVTLEYSAPLTQDSQARDMQPVCQAIFEALAAHPAIPHPASLKIRARPCHAWKTGGQPDSFAHAQLSLLPGRDDATKTDLSGVILDVLQAHLPDIGSLSVDVSDLSPTYTKRIL